MAKINLKSGARIVTGKKVKKLRREGKIPAVLYGGGIKTQPLWVNYLDFQKVFEEAGRSAILKLDIDGKKKANVLIQDVQFDPLTGKFSHADFFQVRMDQKIETEVPLEFIGESEAVTGLGGVMVKSLDVVQVNCLPADLPAKIEVDISVIKTFDDSVKIKDLKIPEGVKTPIDPETVVVNVTPPRSEEELAQLEEKVEEDVTKVEGVAEKVPAEGETEETAEAAKGKGEETKAESK